jgi:hypothetical protein
MIFNFLKKYRNRNLTKVAEQQLKENAAVITSLRDYDEGKKDISTAHLEKRLPGIRVASQA